MQRVDGSTITMTRGDTARIAFTLKLDGVPYELQSGDAVRFAINTADHEDEPLFSRDLDGYVLTLNPEDTKDFEFGTYLYDVQIVFAESGDTLTYITKAKLKLTWEAD